MTNKLVYTTNYSTKYSVAMKLLLRDTSRTVCKCISCMSIYNGRYFYDYNTSFVYLHLRVLRLRLF